MPKRSLERVQTSSKTTGRHVASSNAGNPLTSQTLPSPFDAPWAHYTSHEKHFWQQVMNASVPLCSIYLTSPMWPEEPHLRVYSPGRAGGNKQTLQHPAAATLCSSWNGAQDSRDCLITICCTWTHCWQQVARLLAGPSLPHTFLCSA